jgi:homeobox protein cut-like
MDFTVLQKWSLANLPSLQKLLDTQSLEIFSSQNQSLESRRRLADKTRDFKKISNPSLPEFKLLLKEYQHEIDCLHKRSKVVKGYFLDVYKVLVELPDPVVHLERLGDHLGLQQASQALTDDNLRLKGVIEGLERDGSLWGFKG